MLTDADYAAIHLRVLQDAGVYIAQASNVGCVAVKIFGYLCLCVPVVIFWGSVAAVMSLPDATISISAMLQDFTLNDIRHDISIATFIVIMSMLLVYLFGLSRFGYINRFDDAVGAAIRKHCDVAAEGEVVLSWLDTTSMSADAKSFG